MKPCPGCGMPREDDPPDTGPCPVCSLSPPPPADPAPADAPAPAVRPLAPVPGGRGWRTAAGVAVGLLALTGAAAGGYWLRAATEPGPAPVAVAAPPRTEPPPVVRPGPAPEAPPPANLPEVPVTGAVTLTPAALGRSHVCTGTTDYTVTLPDPAGHAGRSLWVRMAPDLKTLVTLDAGAGAGIDGERRRVMWAGEAALLVADGANWSKVAGKTRPMRCTMRRAGGQAVPPKEIKSVDLDQADADNTGRMADPGNHRMVVRRGGDYLAVGVVVWDAWEESAGNRAVAECQRNGDGVVLVQGEVSTSPGVFAHPGFTAVLRFAAGDKVELKCYQGSERSQPLYGTEADDAPSLTLVEQPSW